MATEIGIDDLQGVLDDVAKQFGDIDYQPVLVSALKDMESLHESYFASGAGPAGTWPPNAPSTVRRKGHATVLVEKGKLRASLNSPGGDAVRDVFKEGADNQHGLVFGTSVEHSIFNQEGTPTAPARPHVGLTEQALDRIAENVADYTVERLKE